VTTPRGTSGQRHGAPRPRGPDRVDPRLEDGGRRIFTEDDLDGYFRAVDPRVLARDRRRRHRRHGIVLGLVALLLAGLAVTAVQVLRGQWSIPGWEASPPQEPLLCPAGTFSYVRESPVTVFNGTTIAGLAGDVADALEERRFAISGVGNKGFSTSNMVAVIISGPEGEDTAFALQRNVEGSVYRPDGREGDTVDIIMGTKYTGLVPAQEISTQPGPLDCQRLATQSPPATTG
jgi:LytR cell envelope-related transcriptional attenuator